MRRRHLIPLALCLPVFLPLGGLAWGASTDTDPTDDAPQAPPHYKVSAALLQQAVAQRFPLRYEARDLTVRAHQLRFKRLTMPSLQPSVVALLNTYGPALSEQALLEVVLHRLQPSDLALPNSMGLQPGRITVTDTGLVIGFVPKPLSQP